MRHHILLVDDEEDLVATLDYNLQREGLAVTTALSGAAALARLAEPARFDLVVLDLMLPDMSGTEICRHLRAMPHGRLLPVVMLTARGEELDRVLGFEMGADDYVVKPFSVRELTMRIRAILRRSARPSADEEVVRFGPLRLDLGAHRVWVDDEDIRLTALEFRLLVTFLDRRGRVQTRETLLADVWGIQAEVTTRTVDTHVKRLREKLGAAGTFIETLRGVGYRFSAVPPATPRMAACPA